MVHEDRYRLVLKEYVVRLKNALHHQCLQPGNKVFMRVLIDSWPATVGHLSLLVSNNFL